MESAVFDVTARYVGGWESAIVTGSRTSRAGVKAGKSRCVDSVSGLEQFAGSTVVGRYMGAMARKRRDTFLAFSQIKIIVHFTRLLVIVCYKFAVS